MDRPGRLVIAVLVGAWMGGARADDETQIDDEDVPDLEFLEYLGSWRDSDEEWLIFSEWEDDRAPRADARPEVDVNEDD